MDDREVARFLLNGRVLESNYVLSADAEDAEEGKKKKGRTTGQKVLRGAAVAGGVAVLAVGGAIAALLIQCNSDEGCGE